MNSWVFGFLFVYDTATIDIYTYRHTLSLRTDLPIYWLLLVFIAIFGITLGARGPVISTLAAEIFAGGGQGTIYGTITMGLGLGAGFGSWVSGTLYDLTGGYETGFAFAALSICCAIAQFWLVPALGRDRSRA